MILKYSHKKLTWVDLECPTQEEVRQVMNDFSINPHVAQELMGPSIRPKVDLYPNLIYLILHLPVIRRNGSTRHIEQQEIDFIIGKDFIVTSRYDAIDPLHQFSKLFEVNSILDRSEMSEHAGYIFFYMVRTLYESILTELETVADTINSIEENVFNGQERAMVIKLSETGRELLDIKRSLRLHKEIFESFASASRVFFGDSFSFHTQSIINEYFKVSTSLSSSFESIAELRETNNSLLNTRETETMKIVTIIAFLTLPASLITNLFDMGATGTPFVNEPGGWFIVTTIAILGSLIVFIIAKFKKWF